MKIAIVGCGITGTAVAYFLGQAGHEVTVFEQAKECQPIGAGIMLQPSGQTILKRIGILDQVVDRSERLEGLTAKLASGSTLVRLRYDWLNQNCFGLGVHRGELFELLLDRCRQSGAKIVNDARIVSSGERVIQNETSEIRIETESGEQFSGFDFVIAADGSNSQARKLAGLQAHVVEYDYAAFWCTGPCTYQPKQLVQVVDGTHRLVGLLPIGHGRSSFFWGLRANQYSDLLKQPIADWKTEVLQVCPDAKSIVDPIEDFSQLTFARYRHVQMPTWFNNHFVVLGDAAHATSPHLGQGVNLALEDAACFADSLAQYGEFTAACRAYSKQRLAKLRYYSRLTRILTPFFQSHGSAKGVLRNIGLPWFPYMPIVRREMVRTLCGFKNGWLR